jgi:hypothetical protein
MDWLYGKRGPIEAALCAQEKTLFPLKGSIWPRLSPSESSILTNMKSRLAGRNSHLFACAGRPLLALY